MKKIVSFLASSAVLFCLMTGQSFAATTAASSMHYGKLSITEKSNSTDAPIVINNYSYQSANVSASFFDGSSKVMTIFPVTNSPYNVITIGDSAPYVMIEIDALDGTVLFPDQAVYPGQQVNINPYSTKTGKKSSVTVSVR